MIGPSAAERHVLRIGGLDVGLASTRPNWKSIALTKVSWEMEIVRAG